LVVPMAPDETKKQEERRGSSKDRRVNNADRRGSGRVDVDEKTRRRQTDRRKNKPG